MMSTTLAHLSPGRVIIAFTAFTILLGTALLALPIARVDDVSWLDLLFTATSSTCVTGMFTIPLAHFTTFGHSVILVLMQVGGLGLITLTIFVLYMLFDLGFGTQLLAGQILEIESWKQARRILKYIMIITLASELLGAAFIFCSIKDMYPLSKALFLSFFHAVSCFCNAGIMLFDQAHINQLPYSYGLLAISSMLMIIGSLGFITWIEVYKKYRAWRQAKRFCFSLSSKIIFWSTLLLISVPALLLLILEHNNAFSHLSWTGKLINALSNSIALRSTGFLTVPVVEFSMASLLVIMLISFIGAAPGSTGSGIKVTTFAIVATIVRSALAGRTAINIKGRRIPKDQVLKSVAIVAINASAIIMATFVLLITQLNSDFLDSLLEASSALTNLGLTTGLTETLLSSSKILIMLGMIAGRIGSLTLVLAFRKQNAQAQAITAESISYPEERIMLG